MKKFLLLIVGVLFALSANAAKAWTIYANVSAKNWENVWLWYGEYKTPVKGWIVDPVNKIYKFQFEQDGTFNMSFTNYGENISDKDYGSTRVGDFGTNNDGDNGYWKIVDGALYTFKSGNDNGTTKKPAGSIYTEQPAVYLVGKFGGVDHWTLPTYKFEGTWSKDGDDFSFTLDLAAAGITSITTSDYFSIINCNDNVWHRRCGDDTELEKGKEYQTWTYANNNGNNITVKETIKNPVITLNSYTWQIKITEKAPEYTYYIHSNFSGEWPSKPSGAILMTKEGDTWTWEGTVANDGSEFGIKRLSAGEGLSGDNTWICAKKGYSALSDGAELSAVIKTNETDFENFTVSSKGDYKITFNPTTNTVKLESTATPDPTGGFTYAIHGQILGNSGWDTYEMKQISNGANWWYLESDKFTTGYFGIKKLKDDKQWTNGTSDDSWGWIRSNESGIIENDKTVTIITPGESWHAAVVETPSHNGTGNWKLSGLETGTKYTIMFNADDLQILVSTVAASGVEDINVDEDAPVEYFNLQGQRVNGELTPGIYIRRQGSTVTKVRF